MLPLWTAKLETIANVLTYAESKFKSSPPIDGRGCVGDYIIKCVIYGKLTFRDVVHAVLL